MLLMTVSKTKQKHSRGGIRLQINSCLHYCQESQQLTVVRLCKTHIIKSWLIHYCQETQQLTVARLMSSRVDQENRLRVFGIKTFWYVSLLFKQRDAKTKRKENVNAEYYWKESISAEFCTLSSSADKSKTDWDLMDSFPCCWWLYPKRNKNTSLGVNLCSFFYNVCFRSKVKLKKNITVDKILLSGNTTVNRCKTHIIKSWLKKQIEIFWYQNFLVCKFAL